MTEVQFSDVQLINLSTLVTIRDSIKHDLAAGCCKFGLHAEQARFLSALSFDQILVMVANIGHESLFPPRQDLVSLLELPVPLARPIASAHPPQHGHAKPLAPFSPSPAALERMSPWR
ncbi:MAG: hypothetical protein V4724_20665 [Pseudomonadota bacterium]